jgi:hypothetical protein
MKKLFNNQKVIKFLSRNIWDDTLNDVLLNLTATGFKMYIYLGLQKDKGTEFVLSRADAMKALNISEGTYHKVIKELKDKNYLIKCADNLYIF